MATTATADIHNSEANLAERRRASGMTTTDIMCSLCGWRNPSWARVCGGCGKPLSSAVPTPADATVQAPAPPTPSTSSDPYPYGMPEARGPSVSPTQPNPAVSPYAPGTTAGAWPPAGRPPQAGMRRRSAGPRVLTVLLIFLIVLLVACAAAWAMLIRPAVHNQVD